MKKLFLLAFGLLFFSSLAWADMISDFHRNFYLGGSGGWALANEGHGPKEWMSNVYDYYINSTLSSADKGANRGGVSGAFFAGYNFLPYFALEGRAIYYATNKYEARGADKISANILDAKLNTYAFDLMAKFSLPLVLVYENFDKLSLYVKGGGAYVFSDFTGSLIDGNPNVANGLVEHDFSYHNHGITPAYGVGVDCELNDHVVLGLSWSGALGKNNMEYVSAASGVNHVSNLDNNIPKTDLLSFDVMYRF
jgi:hypothetical protein